MKIMICGHARHGKDYAAEYLKAQFGFKHDSSSHVAMREFLRDKLAADYGLVYRTEEECYADRVNHREKWFDLIQWYAREDRTKLTRLIFSRADIYVGIRDREQFLAARDEDLVDLALWIDASKRCPPESSASNTILPDDCDLVVPNNGGQRQFERRLWRIFSWIVR
jgi:hypothetical protein